MQLFGVGATSCSQNIFPLDSLKKLQLPCHLTVTAKWTSDIFKLFVLTSSCVHDETAEACQSTCFDNFSSVAEKNLTVRQTKFEQIVGIWRIKFFLQPSLFMMFFIMNFSINYRPTAIKRRNFPMRLPSLVLGSAQFCGKWWDLHWSLPCVVVRQDAEMNE